MTKTQIKLIEAAEREFAEHGFHGASIRNITARAGANVAAINYHFGSKEALFIEMIRYRIEPVNKLRLKLLDQARKSAGDKPLPVRTIVDIILRPLIRRFLAPGSEKADFMRAMGRGLSEENRFMASLRQDILSEVLKRFRAELGRTLSALPPMEVELCFHYLGCTLSGVMLQHKRLKCSSEGCELAKNPDTNADRLVTFVTGGIDAIVANYREKPAESRSSPPNDPSPTNV